jgi:hypothetical protein
VYVILAAVAAKGKMLAGSQFICVRHDLFVFAMTIARRYAKIFPTVRRGENCRAGFDR